MSGRLLYARYERPFVEPFRYGDKIVHGRQGILIRKETELGPRYAEAAPLPGHSRETLESVIKILSSRPAGEVFERVSLQPPSLRFALEALAWAEPAKPLAVRSNALLAWGKFDEMHARADDFRKVGYRVCKVKISDSGWDDLLELVAANPDLLFRLDANRALNARALENLVALFEQRNLLPRLEYLEEPFPEIWSQRQFRGLPLPLAADESALDENTIRLLMAEANPPSVFILKPTVLGRLSSLGAIFDELSVAGKKVIITSSLETEVGRRSIISFLSSREFGVCGLSTGSLFRDNFMKDQPAWGQVPALSGDEIRYLESLAWKEWQ